MGSESLSKTTCSIAYQMVDFISFYRKDFEPQTIIQEGIGKVHMYHGQRLLFELPEDNGITSFIDIDNVKEILQLSVKNPSLGISSDIIFGLNYKGDLDKEHIHDMWVKIGKCKDGQCTPGLCFGCHASPYGVTLKEFDCNTGPFGQSVTMQYVVIENEEKMTPLYCVTRGLHYSFKR